MEKKLFILLAFIFFISLQSCKKDDDRAGIGVISYQGDNFKLYNARRDIHNIGEIGGVSIDNVYYNNNYHVLHLTGKNWGTKAGITIRSVGDLVSGEYYLEKMSAKYDYNSIQMAIELADDFVFFARHKTPTKKVNLTYSEKGDSGIYEVELKYVDSNNDEDNFLIKWKGPFELFIY